MACTQVIQCESAVMCTAVAPDGQLQAAGLWSGGVLLLDAHTGERRTIKPVSTARSAFSVVFSPAGASPLLLAAGFFDGTVRVWDCSSDACVAVLQGPLQLVSCIAFSPDGRLLASTSNDESVQLWRTDDWRAPPAVLRGHTDGVFGVSFSCDRRLLASCSMDRTVRLWHILDRGATAAAAPAAVATAGPTLEVGQQVCCLAFSPVDGKLLTFGGYGSLLALASVGEGDAIALERELQGHTNVVRSVAFSNCGRTLASASNDRTVRLWSVAGGTCLRVLQEHTDIVTGVAFFLDGKQLASCSNDKNMRIWTLCAWSDMTHHLFGAPLKAAIFTLMCVRARLELDRDGQHALQLPRLPMEVWLLVFGQLQLALALVK